MNAQEPKYVPETDTNMREQKTWREDRPHCRQSDNRH